MPWLSWRPVSEWGSATNLEPDKTSNRWWGNGLSEKGGMSPCAFAYSIRTCSTNICHPYAHCACLWIWPYLHISSCYSPPGWHQETPCGKIFWRNRTMPQSKLNSLPLEPQKSQQPLSLVAIFKLLPLWPYLSCGNERIRIEISRRVLDHSLLYKACCHGGYLQRQIFNFSEPLLLLSSLVNEMYSQFRVLISNLMLTSWLLYSLDQQWQTLPQEIFMQQPFPLLMAFITRSPLCKIPKPVQSITPQNQQGGTSSLRPETRHWSPRRHSV